ncbi:MAG: U32 family peptidase, partial [Oscillospiraceae bacterium]
ESIKEKTVLELPRDMLGGTEKLKEQIADAMFADFDKFCVQNIGQLPLVKGETVFSSFTLNVSNSLAAKKYAQLGVEFITLSPEITLEHIKRIDSGIKTIVYAYGHIPLMLTKSCPLQNVRNCADCPGQGFLVDRKGMQLPVRCHGKAGGYREIFNPIPIYMGERVKEINSDYISLNFTIEAPQRVREILEQFVAARPFDVEFTRGLYYKASI